MIKDYLTDSSKENFRLTHQPLYAAANVNLQQSAEEKAIIHKYVKMHFQLYKWTLNYLMGYTYLTENYILQGNILNVFSLNDNLITLYKSFHFLPLCY